jgi:hypothetical protein
MIDYLTVEARRGKVARASARTGAGLAMVFVVILALAVPALTRATPAVSGSATSSVVPCLQVGSGYLSTPNPNVYEKDVYLYWTGTVTSARLVGYEFNAGGTHGRYVKVNGVQIGTATGQRSGQTQCRGFEGLEPLSWPISNPGILKQGRNTIRIEIDPAMTTETSWGISRAQIEVSGVDVDGRHYRQVTIPSTYFNNWQGYANEGTWTHIMEPQGYDGSAPRPLLISAHGFGSNAWESMQDYHDAAAARAGSWPPRTCTARCGATSWSLTPCPAFPRRGLVAGRWGRERHSTTLSTSSTICRRATTSIPAASTSLATRWAQ